jgi:hypothetical protein
MATNRPSPVTTADAAIPNVRQNLFTVVVEHTDGVESMSQQIRDLINALPAVLKVGILLPSAERDIVVNDGSGEFRKVMR